MQLSGTPLQARGIDCLDVGTSGVVAALELGGHVGKPAP